VSTRVHPLPVGGDGQHEGRRRPGSTRRGSEAAALLAATVTPVGGERRRSSALAAAPGPRRGEGLDTAPQRRPAVTDSFRTRLRDGAGRGGGTGSCGAGRPRRRRTARTRGPSAPRSAPPWRPRGQPRPRGGGRLVAKPAASACSARAAEAGAPSAKTRDLLTELGCDAVISAKGLSLQAGRRLPVERTNSWHNRGFGKLRVCTVIEAFIALANAVIIVRRLVRIAWTTHRWDNRPQRRP
jgi:hypothetical protein